MKTSLTLLLALSPLSLLAQATFGGTAHVVSFTSVAATPSGVQQPDIAWWTFDGAGTSCTDYSSVGTNTLTLANAAMRVAGGTTNGIASNGSTYYAYTQYPVKHGTNIITVCFWYNPQGAGTVVQSESSANFNSNGGTWVMIPFQDAGVMGISD